ncbi:MAG: hypothetical protein ACR2GD_02120 [Pyrinomonadaceae bacterium]
MEILILGGILVAAMVYLSTKIKRGAAQAYEPETVENDEYKFFKSEGFLIPLNENSGFLLEARSKDFGADEAKDFSQAKVELKVLTSANFDAKCKEARQSLDKITMKNFSDDTAKGQKIYRLEGEESDGETIFEVFRKIVESKSQKKIYDLKIRVLRNYRDDYFERINQMLENFSVK